MREPDTATVVAFTTGVDGNHRLVVMGPRTHATYLAPKNVALCAQVRIRPGRAQPLLGLPMSELTDRIVDLRELWGGQALRLVDELAALAPAERRITARMEAEFTRRLAARSADELARADLVRHAAQRLASDQRRVPEVARSIGVSERHLRALFTDGVGMAPKRFSSIGRVRGVLGHVDGGAEWAAVATRTGYYDQSHMTAEFREVMGVPPGAFRAGKLPAAGPCTP